MPKQPSSTSGEQGPASVRLEDTGKGLPQCRKIKKKQLKFEHPHLEKVGKAPPQWATDPSLENE
jgi:hypothetical protein